jgi:Arc/MetJ-type ribon-helix-helix transcriptional regulator
MPRKRSKVKSVKVWSTITEQQAVLIQRLVDSGRYGGSESEVIRYILTREIDRLFPPAPEPLSKD